MSLWSRIRRSLGGADTSRTPGEADTPTDTRTAHSRPTGGAPSPDAPDTHSTTGSTPSETFVGQASGDEASTSGVEGSDVRSDEPPDSSSGAARR
jgi:hypothetical protein